MTISDGEGEIEALGTIQKWIIPSNWKIVAENFAGDMLHNISHQSVDLVGIGPNGERGRRDDYGQTVMTSYGNGHAGVYLDHGDRHRTDYQQSEVVAEYFQMTNKRRHEAMGDEAKVTFGVGTIFPNMSFHGTQPRTILTAHPLGPDRTEMWRSYFVDKDAPKEVKQFLRKFYLRYSGPGGMTEQDDMENWNYATSASGGVIGKRLPYNYMAGMGNEGSRADMPGARVATSNNSEQNARTLYDQWAVMMSAADGPSDTVATEATA
jgi:phenylpropionate dioxygenase-like ring-hydroxylating dioxygenase large terminal subunit